MASETEQHGAQPQRQLVTLHAESEGERLQEALEALGRALPGGTVGAPDDTGLLEIELTAGSHEEALGQVRDAMAAAGVDDHFTFPSTTGTEYRPPWRRAPQDQPAGEPEPPHLERGGARESRPDPQDPPGSLQREL